MDGRQFACSGLTYQIHSSGHLHLRALSGPVFDFWDELPDSKEDRTIFQEVTQAADRMISRRRQILDYLDEVPFAIADAEECCQIFPKEFALDANRTDLYLAILGAIMNRMEWLLEKSGCKIRLFENEVQ